MDIIIKARQIVIGEGESVFPCGLGVPIEFSLPGDTEISINFTVSPVACDSAVGEGSKTSGTALAVCLCVVLFPHSGQ